MWNILIKNRIFLSIPTLIAVIVFIFIGYLFSVFVARYVFLVACVTWLILNIDAYIYSDRSAFFRDEKKSS